MGVCALILLVLPAKAQSQSDADLGAQLKRHLSTLAKDRQVLQFFESHARLLTDPRFAAEAKRQVRLHTASLDRIARKAATTRSALANRARNRRLASRARNRQLASRAQTRRLAGLDTATPHDVICRVFGGYCHQALAVSQCESGLRTDAQNGQYLGLFQMGASERHLFGHGPSAAEQVTAAHRYFVASGRDWSPWSCKP